MKTTTKNRYEKFKNTVWLDKIDTDVDIQIKLSDNTHVQITVYNNDFVEYKDIPGIIKSLQQFYNDTKVK